MLEKFLPAKPTTSPRTDPNTLHPAAAEAAAAYSKALDDAAQLRAENAALSRDNDTLAQRLVALEDLVNVERRAKEMYQRHAVALRTHLRHVALTFVSGLQDAYSAGLDEAELVEEEQQIEKAVDALNAQITKATVQEAGSLEPRGTDADEASDNLARLSAGGAN